MNEEKMDELLRLMRAAVPDISDMTDAGKVGFVYKRDYDSAASYEKLDVVKFGMSLWTPKKDTTGNAPPDQSQEGQESVEENEFWTLFLPGALGSEYVKKTDIAKPPTDSTQGKAGIVIPDGKTIQIDENGLMTGTPLDFSGTWDELFAGIESGEVKNGMVGYVKGTKSDPDNPNHPNNMLFDIDDYLSLISSNAVQNRIITAALNQIREKISVFQSFGDDVINITSEKVRLNFAYADVVGDVCHLYISFKLLEKSDIETSIGFLNEDIIPKRVKFIPTGSYGGSIPGSANLLATGEIIYIQTANNNPNFDLYMDTTYIVKRA